MLWRPNHTLKPHRKVRYTPAEAPPACTKLPKSKLESSKRLSLPAQISRVTTIMPKPKRSINAVAEQTLVPPDDLAQNEQIARLKQAAGNNLYHLELRDGSTILAELNQKFRSTIWLRRGSYVLVDTTALADRENKLGGEIVNIVGDEKAWRKMPYWPAEFAAKKTSYGNDSDEEDEGPQMPPSDEEDD